MAPILRNLAEWESLDDAANCQLHLDYRRHFGIWLCERHVELPGCRRRDAKGGGIERKKTVPINVPMIANGTVDGYIVAQFVYLADAKTLQELSVSPDDFITDEAFRALYAGTVDFNHLEKYDLQGLSKTLVEKINHRLGREIIKEISWWNSPMYQSMKFQAELINALAERIVVVMNW